MSPEPFYSRCDYSNLTSPQKALWYANTTYRVIGYIPIIGCIVGIPRIAYGAATLLSCKMSLIPKGEMHWNEGDMTIRYSGNRAVANAHLNIYRGFFECVGMGIVPFTYDASMVSYHGDAWFLCHK